MLRNQFLIDTEREYCERLDVVIPLRLHPQLGFFLSSPETDKRGAFSWRGLVANLLRHLFGTVVGKAETHDGQHHGDLVGGAVTCWGLHLTSYLSLQREHQNKVRTVF